MPFILALDQGTTSSRAIVFDEQGHMRAVAQREFPQVFPRPGWVEHDPEEIWLSQLNVAQEAIARAKLHARDLAAIGIANQRETTIIWDRKTGKPIHNAIVWQDRRTADQCAILRAEGAEPEIARRTGLLVDPYFSATKIAWILDEVKGAREAAEDGRLMAGTVDTWLIWCLTGGAVHATDATNASRTMMFNIHAAAWDIDLCEMLRVPGAVLPQVRDCADNFGETDPAVFGHRVPILGVAGDQQAAAIGQACFRPGMLKSTYGTGCFALLNTGETPVLSTNRLLTTIAYQFDGRPVYALEGSIFIAGAVVQWLRDGLQILSEAGESGALAAQADDAQDVYLVPAFTGLGAPYWNAECRGAIYGLTRATGRAEFARAALESVAFQTRDLLGAMQGDWQGVADTVLRVDGGMTASDWTMQSLADITGAPVDRPAILETTALGAAWLAGMQAGLCPDMDAFAESWALERRFEPVMPVDERERRYAGWQDAVRRTLSE